MVSSAERMRPHRTLRILVVALAIEDGQTPAPVVGSVGSFPLLFEETAADDSDPTIVTVHADAEPLGFDRGSAEVHAPVHDRTYSQPRPQPLGGGAEGRLAVR
jgi:hypothetical protein